MWIWPVILTLYFWRILFRWNPNFFIFIFYPQWKRWFSISTGFFRSFALSIQNDYNLRKVPGTQTVLLKTNNSVAVLSNVNWKSIIKYIEKVVPFIYFVLVLLSKFGLNHNCWIRIRFAYVKTNWNIYCDSNGFVFAFFYSTNKGQNEFYARAGWLFAYCSSFASLGCRQAKVKESQIKKKRRIYSVFHGFRSLIILS